MTRGGAAGRRRFAARAMARAGVALAVVTLAAAPALSHPDETVAEATLRLSPGDVVAFPVSVHYHRLAATYRVEPPGVSGPTLLVVGEEATGVDAIVATSLTGAGGLHHLIACCLGVGYSEVRLVVRHDGPLPVHLELRAWAVHDDFAVVTHRAEPGALEVPLAAFLGLGFAAVRVAARERRRRGPATGPADDRRAAVVFGWSLGLFAWASAAALALAVAGAVRYGAGPIDGMIAVLADVPVPGGPFGSRGATMMGLLLLAWTGSIALWIWSVRLGAHLRSPWPLRLGLALAAVSLAGGLALGWTYGRWAVPVGLGLVLAVPLGVAVVALAPGARRGGVG
jgi:hypothetical protein